MEFTTEFGRKKRISPDFENSLLSVEITALYGEYLDFPFEFQIGHIFGWLVRILLLPYPAGENAFYGT